MNGYIVKNTSGYHFAQNKGFSVFASAATVFPSKAAADKLVSDSAQFGITGLTVVEVKMTSYAVGYIRKGDLNSDNSIKSNTNNPSRRRFATIEEARKHGSRFAERKAKGSKVKGSAGHIGYYVVETNDPVNATVNFSTGLTNKL